MEPRPTRLASVHARALSVHELAAALAEIELFLRRGKSSAMAFAYAFGLIALQVTAQVPCLVQFWAPLTHQLFVDIEAKHPGPPNWLNEYVHRLAVAGDPMDEEARLLILRLFFVKCDAGKENVQ